MYVLTIKTNNEAFFRKIFRTLSALAANGNGTVKVSTDALKTQTENKNSGYSDDYIEKKKLAISLLKNEKSCEEIARLTGFTLQQVRAFKAHLNMGTYL